MDKSNLNNNVIEINSQDLPLHCPNNLITNNTSYHPRVFLAIEATSNKQILCPYCSTIYRLVQK